jgi:hypothetical protein
MEEKITTMILIFLMMIIMELSYNLCYTSTSFSTLQDFLNEPQMIEYKNQRKTSLLPRWVRDYQRLEEGPISITEQQTNLLWDNIDRLQQKLHTQTIEYETKLAALEKKRQKRSNNNKKKKKNQSKNGVRKRKFVSFSEDSGNNEKRRKNTATTTEGEGDNNGNNREENNEGNGAVTTTTTATTTALTASIIDPRQASIQARGRAVAAAALHQYAPYYQERTRYDAGGGWPGNNGTRRFF